MLLFDDPGECIVCGAPHCSCVHGADGRIVIDQLPASTAAAKLHATTVQATLPPGEFTTGTYRGSPPRRLKRRTP